MPATLKTIATSKAAEGAWRQGGGEAPRDLFASIAAIPRTHTDPRPSAGAFLDAVVESLGCLAGSMTVEVGGEEIDLERQAEVEGVAAWADTLRGTALEARSHARSIARLFGPGTSPEFAVIASPIDSSGLDPFGAVAVLVRCTTTAQAERIQLHLRAACLQVASVLARPTGQRGRVEMSDIARVYARAGQFRGLHEFAYAITNAARQRFHCDQAAMGAVGDGKVRLLCISGLDHIKRRSPGVHSIEQAMGECADAACPIVAQPRDRWEDLAFAEEGLLHQRWRASAAGSCVLSIPVDAGDGPVAVLSFRRAGDQPFTADDVEAGQKMLAPLAGAIPLVSRATRRLPRHAAQSACDAAAWCLVRGTIRRRALILLALAGVAWGAFGDRTYRVSMPAVVVAEHEHIVSAPIDGAVVSVLVRLGQHVEAGEPLVQMDTSALELECREIEAEMGKMEMRTTEGIAAGDPAAASLARGEWQALRSRLERVLERLGEATVLSPRAGIVIGPELSELQGRVLAVGDPMVLIAEAGALNLELRVPESRVTDLAPGSRVRFASHARPEDPGFTTLTRVAPASVERGGRPVFIAEAVLPGEQSWLRPGMEGVAMVEAGKRPNWWLAIHRVVDGARLRFWLD